MAAMAQLILLEPQAPKSLLWAGQGRACRRCAEGRMSLVYASDPCACIDAICMCLAEGYAKCDHCDAVEQVWPREIIPCR